MTHIPQRVKTMAALSLGLTQAEYEERIKDYEQALQYQRLLEKQLKDRMRYVSDSNATALLSEYKTLQDQWEAIRTEHSKQLAAYIQADGTITATTEQEAHDRAMANHLGITVEAFRERVKLIEAKNRQESFAKEVGTDAALIFHAEENNRLIEERANRIARPLPSPIIGARKSE